LWLVTLFTMLVRWSLPTAGMLFLNVTGLFGLFKWDAYIATGAWSIGNELVFYLFFPVLVFSAKRSKPFFYLFCLTALLLFIWFAYFKISSESSLVKEWRNYINPLNQSFLFVGGFLIGYFFKNI